MINQKDFPRSTPPSATILPPSSSGQVMKRAAFQRTKIKSLPYCLTRGALA